MSFQELYLACQNGESETVEQLLKDESIDPSAQNNNCLIVACSGGHQQVVQMLLQKNEIDPTAQNNAAIKGACMSGNAYIINMLYCDPRGVDPPLECLSECLVSACFLGHQQIVEKLLQNPMMESLGRSLLWTCIGGQKNYNILEMLLRDPRCTPARILMDNGWQQWHPWIVDRLRRDPRILPPVIAPAQWAP